MDQENDDRQEMTTTIVDDMQATTTIVDDTQATTTTVDDEAEVDTSCKPTSAAKDEDKEVFKLDVGELPSHCTVAFMKDFLKNTLGLNPFNVNMARGGTHPIARLSFTTKAQRTVASRAIHGFKLRGSKLKVQIVEQTYGGDRDSKPAFPDYPKKRYSIFDDDKIDPAVKEKKILALLETMKKKQVPLQEKSYDVQLELKRASLDQFMSKVCLTMVTSNPALKEWIQDQKKAHKGLPCEMEAMRPCPIREAYRTRSSLGVGVHYKTGEWILGISDTSKGVGTKEICPIDDIQIFPNCMKYAAKVFEKFLNVSNKPVSETEQPESYWNQLLVNTSGEDVMLVANADPELPLDKVEALKEEITFYFTYGEGRDDCIKSVYFGLAVKSLQKIVKPQLVYGDEYLHETIKGLNFRFGSDVPFPVNPVCMEVLFDAMVDLAPPDEDTAFIDVFCNAYSLDLILAKNYGEVHVFGAHYPEEAYMNAAENNITNCHFYTDKANENDAMKNVLEKIERTNLIFLIYPKTSVVGKDLMRLMRSTPAAKRILIVTSNSQVTSNNLAEGYCTPTDEVVGDPFVFVKGIPVDIFPHKERSEVVLLLERMEGLKVIAPKLDLKPLRHSMNYRGRDARRRTGKKRSRFDSGGGRNARPLFPRQSLLEPLLGQRMERVSDEELLYQQERMAFAVEALRKFDEERGKGRYPNADGEMRRGGPPPRQRDIFSRRQRDDFPPRQRDNFPPRQRDNFPPRQRDNFRPRQRDDFPPRQRDDFPTGSKGGLLPAPPSKPSTGFWKKFDDNTDDQSRKRWKRDESGPESCEYPLPRNLGGFRGSRFSSSADRDPNSGPQQPQMLPPPPPPPPSQLQPPQQSQDFQWHNQGDNSGAPANSYQSPTNFPGFQQNSNTNQPASFGNRNRDSTNVSTQQVPENWGQGDPNNYMQGQWNAGSSNAAPGNMDSQDGSYNGGTNNNTQGTWVSGSAGVGGHY